jgi:hypothetical protein
MILKFYDEISVSFELVQNLETSVLAMAKVKKVNIAFTYSNGLDKVQNWSSDLYCKHVTIVNDDSSIISK